MFCPVIGVPEDPVSGNAHGMLGVYLLHNGLLTPTDGKARSSDTRAASSTDRAASRSPWRCVGKRATGVRVTGDAVIVFEAALPL